MTGIRNECSVYDSWGGASAPTDPPIKSAWRPPNMDMDSGCYIHIMDIYSGCYIQHMDIYILDFGNLGTNVATGSIRTLTLDIASRIYIHILDITSRIHIHIWRPPGRLNGGSGGQMPPQELYIYIYISIYAPRGSS